MRVPLGTPLTAANTALWEAINAYAESGSRLIIIQPQDRVTADVFRAVNAIVKIESARLSRIFALIDGRTQSESGWIQFLVDEALGKGDRITRRAALEATGITASMLDEEEPRIADSDTCPCCLGPIADDSRVVNGKRVCVGCVGLANAGITVPGVDPWHG